MTSAERRRLARVAAPAAFLLAATIGVLAVRAALADDEQRAAPERTAQTTTQPPPRPAQRRPRRPRRPPIRTHVVQCGDTYLTIADEYDTSVRRLLQLNPGVDPNALVVGQRIRVPRR